MAEAVGLAASIIQIAGAGIKLSTALYNYSSAASRADQDVADIANDVNLTSQALDNIGKVFEQEDGNSVVSKKALEDARAFVEQCEAVFKDIQELIDKGKIRDRDVGKLSRIGKLAWPLRSQRVELLKKRLESLKNSLMLLLHVLQLANAQAKGKMESHALEQDRERIRDLHKHQQETLKTLQSLESKLSNPSLESGIIAQPTLYRSPTATVHFMTTLSTASALAPTKREAPNEAEFTASSTIHEVEPKAAEINKKNLKDESRQLTAEKLTQCVEHVQLLLKQVTSLQQFLGEGPEQHRNHCSKAFVRNMYERFCHDFERELSGPEPDGIADHSRMSYTPWQPSTAPPPAYNPSLYQNSSYNIAPYNPARYVPSVPSFRPSSYPPKKPQETKWNSFFPPAPLTSAEESLDRPETDPAQAERKRAQDEELFNDTLKALRAQSMTENQVPYSGLHQHSAPERHSRDGQSQYRNPGYTPKLPPPPSASDPYSENSDTEAAAGLDALRMSEEQEENDKRHPGAVALFGSYASLPSEPPDREGAAQPDFDWEPFDRPLGRRPSYTSSSVQLPSTAEKMENTSETGDGEDGKDIVDILLAKWTVPAHQ